MIFKRIMTVILAILYFSFTSGATMHIHYCMGQFVGISLNGIKKGVCGNCGMQEHDAQNNCCKDLSFTAKISDAHKTVSGKLNVESCLPVLIPSFFTTHENRLYKGTYFSFGRSKCYPPGMTKCYIKFRNLRI